MTEPKFNLGERVCGYSVNSGLTDTIEKHIGTVSKIKGDLIFVLSNGYLKTFHFKQLRRLIPKKRREIWVNEYDNPKTSSLYFPSKEIARQNAAQGFVKSTRFVEAKEK